MRSIKIYGKEQPESLSPESFVSSAGNGTYSPWIFFSASIALYAAYVDYADTPPPDSQLQSLQWALCSNLVVMNFVYVFITRM